MIKRTLYHFHFCCGLGGGAAGFNRARPRVGNVEAKWVCLGGIDVDPAGLRDFERLAGVPGTLLDLFTRDQYVRFHGKEPPAGWREATPEDVRRAAQGKRPDAVFISSPCWDSDVPPVEVWAECLRVLKPGGYLLAFAGTRTQHRMAVRIEDAGFEIRDMIAWVYGSGFPKSKNLDGDRQGWGTALKPALEPITVARKPLVGTVAANVLAHGTGALNIDACRIPTDETLRAGSGGIPRRHDEHVPRTRSGEASAERRYIETGGTNFAMKPGPRGGDAAGRWPANLIHDGSIEVVALFPADAGQAAPLATRNSDKTRNSYGTFAVSPDAHFSQHDAGGSAARFFYCAKASRRDRNEGCEHMERKPLHWSSGSQNPGSFQSDGTDKTSQNNHPTVKPTDLMAYLVRLVTPPGGKVLDPFTGSGSTGKAAVREGFEFVGIEREPPYLAIAEARIAYELERVTAAALETAEAEAQLDIFRDAKEQIA